LEQQADLDDTSVTAFMLDTVTSRAKRVTARVKDLRASLDSSADR
jgi:uncharacterized protein (DUF1778 family)